MPEDLYRRVDSCRVCGGSLATVLDLGEPFISDFLALGQQGDRAPLVMARCEDCTLVQTRHTVRPERLFRDYWYRSGTNETMVAALADVVRDAAERVVLEPGDRVLDIGCNDGTLLRQWPGSLLCEGYEPSKLGAEALDVAAVHLTTFPDAQVFLPHHRGRYKVITSVAMFYAVDRPQGFVQAIKHALHPEGVWVVQMQDLAHVLRDRAFDYFCHEHLCLYSPASFAALLAPHGLHILDISRNDVNGGSIRFTVGHGSGPLPQPLMPEDLPGAWTAFKTDIMALRDETVGLLSQLRDTGHLVLGYGASTKGGTLLQYYGIGPELLPAVAERQEAKWGRQMVTGIPIISEDEARAMKPDYFFVLPWSFADAFERRERVPLIVPLPRLKLRTRARAAA